MIAAFCAALARGESAILETACHDWLGPAFAPFREAGLLRFHVPSRRVLCEACFDQHWLEVEWDDAAQRPIARCPLDGPFFVDDAQLTMVAVDAARCLQAVQVALLSKQQRVRELVPDKAWHLGIAQSGDIDWNAILVPAALTGPEMAMLAEGTAKLPQCMLDVVLIGDLEPWTLRAARPLHALPFTEVADWSGAGIVVRQDLLRRWLQSFVAGLGKSAGTGGRPALKTTWLHANWRRFETELVSHTNDTERAKLLSAAYSKEFGGGKISRPTVIPFLDEVMPSRAKNCR